MADLDVAEIFYESGQVHYRYARYMADDGSRWLRHGLFKAYYPDGTVASEGYFKDGVEDGPWRDFHANGHVAAEGAYEQGKEVGSWKFWNEDGSSPSADATN